MAAHVGPALSSLLTHHNTELQLISKTQHLRYTAEWLLFVYVPPTEPGGI
jgi:hypothetical protein